MSPLASWGLVIGLLVSGLLLAYGGPCWLARMADRNLFDLEAGGGPLDEPIPYSVTTAGQLASEVISAGPMTDAEWDAYLAESPAEDLPDGWGPADDHALRQLLARGDA